jgi:hypothetical protein
MLTSRSLRGASALLLAAAAAGFFRAGWLAPVPADRETGVHLTIDNAKRLGQRLNDTYGDSCAEIFKLRKMLKFASYKNVDPPNVSSRISFKDPVKGSPTVDRRWLCHFLTVSCHIDANHGLDLETAMFKILVATMDYNHFVTEWDNWHQLRHHVGSFLYEYAQQNDFPFQRLLKLQVDAKMYVYKCDDGMALEDTLALDGSNKWFNAGFAAIVHGMGWEVFIEAAHSRGPEFLWEWVAEFEEANKGDKHVQKIFSAHTLGHGAFYYAVMRDAVQRESALVKQYSVCTPFRPHSLSLPKSMMDLALEVCSLGPEDRRSGCRDGLAHSYYQYGWGYSFFSGTTVTQLCGIMDDWWCYFWYQAYLGKFVDVITVCDDLSGGAHERCVGAVSWSRYAVFDTVVFDNCRNDTYDRHYFNMYVHEIDIETFPIDCFKETVKEDKSDLLEVWCRMVARTSNAAVQCAADGALIAKRWLGFDDTRHWKFCRGNFPGDTPVMRAQLAACWEVRDHHWIKH